MQEAKFSRLMCYFAKLYQQICRNKTYSFIRLFYWITIVVDLVWNKIIGILAELNANWVLSAFVIILLAYFAYRVWRFWLKISPLTKDLERLNDFFNVGKNEVPQKAHTKFYHNYSRINKLFSSIHVHSLSHLWWEYRENFIFPEETEASNLDRHELVVKTSQSPHNFFNEETIIERHIDLRRLESASTTLTSIGILGTFTGLTVGIAGLSSNLASFESDNLTIALTMLLKGASLAFITSVAGMLLAILFSSIEKHCLRKAKEQIVQFVDKLERSLLLTTSEHGHRDALTELKNHTRLLENFSNELATAIGNAVSGAVSSAFSDPKFYQVVTESIDKNISLAVNESLDKLTSASNALAEAGVSINKNLERLESNNRSLKKLWQSYEQRFKDVDGNLAKLFGEFDKTTSKFQHQSNQYLSELTDNFTKAIGFLNDKIKDSLVDKIEQQNNHIDKQVAEQQKLADFLKNLHELLKKISGQLDKET